MLDLPGFEGSGAKIHDVSRYHNNGIFGAGAAAPTWVMSPSGLWVLNYDGVGQYVSCGASASLNITGAMTILVFTNPTDKANYGAIVSKIDATEGANIQFILAFNSGGADTLAFYTNAWKESTFTATYGSWGMYGITYDGANVSFIKNTTIEAGQAILAPASHLTYPLFIGASWSGNPRYGKGMVGKVLISTPELTVSEIMNTFEKYRGLFGV